MRVYRRGGSGKGGGRVKQTSRRKKGMHIFFMLIAIGVLLFGLALGALSLAEANPPAVNGEGGAIVVLGCQVYANGDLSPQLELRLQSCLETYQARPRLIIACGAQGENEPEPEGQAMRKWLIAHGAAEEDVIAECDSRSTRENLKNAQALLPPSITHVTVITSDYHLPRALALARDLGLDADGIGSPCKPGLGFWIKNHTRETLAWGKYLLNKVTGNGD